MSLRWRIVAVLSLGASFLAGFLTHKSGLHAYLRPFVAAARADLGGCSVGQALAALDPDAFDDVHRRLRDTSTVVDRTPDGLACLKTERGTFWVPPGTDLHFVLAEQAVRIYGDGPYRVRPGDVVLDCGANVGAFTREALDAGAAKVVAIEPVPANVESLRRTFSAEIDAGRVLVVPKGVWHRDDTLEMNVYDNGLLNSFVMASRPDGISTRVVQLPLTTIDAIVAGERLEMVHFIKMDIEGAERQALEGARGTIARFKPRLALATENLPDDYVAIPRIVASIDGSYRSAAGDCGFTGRFTVRPGALYFTRSD